MLLPALLCYGGFTALCLSMERHYNDLLAGKPSLRRRRVLKAGGWLLLCVSAWAAVSAEGWTLGLVKWSAVLMASGVLLVFLLPYRPRWVLGLAGAALLLSPLVAWL